VVGWEISDTARGVRFQSSLTMLSLFCILVGVWFFFAQYRFDTCALVYFECYYFCLVFTPMCRITANNYLQEIKTVFKNGYFWIFVIIDYLNLFSFDLYELTLILKNIGQSGLKCIMTLPIKTITAVLKVSLIW